MPIGGWCHIRNKQWNWLYSGKGCNIGGRCRWNGSVDESTTSNSKEKRQAQHPSCKLGSLKSSSGDNAMWRFSRRHLEMKKKTVAMWSESNEAWGMRMRKWKTRWELMRTGELVMNPIDDWNMYNVHRLYCFCFRNFSKNSFEGRIFTMTMCIGLVLNGRTRDKFCVMIGLNRKTCRKLRRIRSIYLSEQNMFCAYAKPSRPPHPDSLVYQS